jgi:hypothetical protein
MQEAIQACINCIQQETIQACINNPSNMNRRVDGLVGLLSAKNNAVLAI